MLFDVALLRKHWVKPIVPVVIILLLGYGNFVGGYSLGYEEVWKHHSHGAAIVLWVLLGFCQVTFFVYWGLLVGIGPGKAPKFPMMDIYNTNDKNLMPQAEIFPCDQYGYPYYDSHTESLMLARSFYLKDAGYVVLKFDHYCVWVGVVVGQDNYLYFMKFIQWMWTYFLVFLIYLAIYAKSNVNRGEINHNFIPGFIFCGMWLLLLTAFVGVHIRYICINMTTLDEITIKQYRQYQYYQLNPTKRRHTPRKEDGIRYVNVFRDNTRLVIAYDIHDGIYNMGYKKNWINLMFNGNRNQNFRGKYDTITLIKSFIVFLLPFIDLYYLKSNTNKSYQDYASEYNGEFLKYIDEKVRNKDCFLALYIKREDL